MKIALPWPPKELNPNTRAHWSQRAKAARFYREEARILTLESAKKTVTTCDKTHYTLEIVFYPPDRRRRDLDNLIASMKPALDGIADALGVDDSRFKLVCSMGDELRGCVEVML